ncbi:small nuclear ribonucleoprotein SmF, partial [Paecilomyces variotii No. 5]
FQPVNPRPFLQARVGAELIIRLKWGQTEYKGKLESIDSYMNVLLRDTEEFIDGKNTGSLGLVLIRCNNILWMASADGVEMTDLVIDHDLVVVCVSRFAIALIPRFGAGYASPPSHSPPMTVPTMSNRGPKLNYSIAWDQEVKRTTYALNATIFDNRVKQTNNVGDVGARLAAPIVRPKKAKDAGVMLTVRH